MLYEMSMDYTYDKHKAFVKFYQEKIKHYTKKRTIFLLICIAAFAVLFLIGTMMNKNSLKIAGVIVLAAGIVCVILLVKKASSELRKGWNPEKTVNGALKVKYKFYDDHLMQITPAKNVKVEYRKLKGKYETDDFIYLMVTKKRAAIIEKKRCPEELLNFIRNTLCK